MGKRNLFTVALFIFLSITYARADINRYYSATIKQGETYLLGCTPYSTSGTYDNTLKAVNNEDSIIHLTLTVDNSVMVQLTKDIEVDQKYLFGCKVLSKSTITGADPILDTLILENHIGGDSIICLALNVKPATKPSVMVRYEKDIELGQNYLFGCKVLTPTAVTTTEPVRDTLILENYQGGDSTICLALNVKPATKPSVMVRYEKDIELGQNYLFGCKVLTPTAVTTTEPVRDTLILENYQGGDSTICLALNVKPATKPSVMVRYEKDIELGQNYLFGCKVLTPTAVTTTEPVRDTLILENYQGGDSTICLALNVTNPCPAVIVVEDTVAKVCEKELPFLWHGMSLKKDTTNCDDTLFNATAHGCDSIVRLQLIVLPYAHGTDKVEGCDSAIFKGITYYASTTVNDTVIGGAANGCDSIVTVTITVKSHAVGTDEVTGCDSVTFKGIKYFAPATVYDTIIGGAANGCDSIVTVTITINKATKSEVTVVECGSYTWNGKEYTKSGDYTFTTTNAAGCDSVATLHLTIKEPQYTTLKQSSCEAVKWGGKTYEPDTVAIDTVLTAIYPAANGCDSIVTLYLHLYPIIKEQVIVDTACVSYTWSVNKKTYTKSTTVTETLESYHGCDSVITLNLTILEPGMRDTAATECNLFVWRDIAYNNDTVVYDTVYGEAKNGCDSIVRLTLHINKPYKYELDLVSKYGDRLLMINRTQVNTVMADTLDRYKDTTLVRWFREATPEDIFLCYGYYYTNFGKPVDPGVYYALIDIPGTNGECGTKAETEHYTVKPAVGAPALMPTLARPGENIRVINLDPAQQTVIRIFTSEGLLQRTYTTSGETSFTIQAADYHGFYLVELSDESMKTTLRYIVQ